MKVLDGRELANNILEETATLAAQNKSRSGLPTTLAIVVASEDESAQWYVRSIAKKAAQVGIDCNVRSLNPSSTQETIASELIQLSQDKAIP